MVPGPANVNRLILQTAAMAGYPEKSRAVTRRLYPVTTAEAPRKTKPPLKKYARVELNIARKSYAAQRPANDYFAGPLNEGIGARL